MPTDTMKFIHVPTAGDKGEQREPSSFSDSHVTPERLGRLSIPEAFQNCDAGQGVFPASSAGN